MNTDIACAIAALTLVALLVAVTFNTLYVNNTFDEITTRLDQAIDIDDIVETQSYWEERRKILSFSLSEPELDKVSLLFDEMIISAEAGNTEEYKKAAARLKRAAEDIKDLEDLSIDNIF